jgi:hypothetical protein
MKSHFDGRGTKSEAEGEKQTARSKEGNGQLGRWREMKTRAEGEERTARLIERNEEPGRRRGRKRRYVKCKRRSRIHHSGQTEHHGGEQSLIR